MLRVLYDDFDQNIKNMKWIYIIHKKKVCIKQFTLKIKYLKVRRIGQNLIWHLPV